MSSSLALIGIICFSLAILPGSPYYYQTAMGIIGKVYANSMLVLLNSRMEIGSEEGEKEVARADEKRRAELRPLEFRHDESTDEQLPMSLFRSSADNSERAGASLDVNSITIARMEQGTTRTLAS